MRPFEERSCSTSYEAYCSIFCQSETTKNATLGLYETLVLCNPTFSLHSIQRLSSPMFDRYPPFFKLGIVVGLASVTPTYTLPLSLSAAGDTPKPMSTMLSALCRPSSFSVL
ncbi:hypothetical protein VKT23_010751 [Stygiomarasmius scandens]|uniref:Uncharacterized protein n=1 Tax=Marasmiellus scandens TaxID=2682957 RepID=A0ABR1JGD5_9AGAR